MLDPATLPDSHNAISSPGSAFGPTHCDGPDGAIAALFGRALAPANLSARQAKEMGFLTSGTYGRPGSTSLASANLAQSLVSRLQVLTAWAGSTLYKLTWKLRDTPGGAVDLCAAGVGAPHIRQRLWFVADSLFAGRPERGTVAGDRQATGSGGACSVADTSESQRGRRPDNGALHVDGQTPGWNEDASNLERDSQSRVVGVTHDARLEGLGGGYQAPGWGAGQLRPVTATSELGGLADSESNRHQRTGEFCESSRGHGIAYGGPIGRVDNSDNTGLEGLGGGYQAPGWGAGQVRPIATASELGGLADTLDRAGYGSQPRGTIGELPQSLGTMQTGHEPAGPVNGHWRDADWLLCRDGKWRPVEPGTFPLANGAPARVGRLRAYGNAINAEAAEEFIRAYMS